jgi:hypothetical protein
MPAGPCRTLLPEQRAEVERQLRAMHKVACELATPSLRSFAQHADCEPNVMMFRREP